MNCARILVIDGNVAEIRARLTAALGYDSGEGYARVLRRIDPNLRVDIVRAADGAELPAGAGLESYQGVTMTGSALNIYNGGPPVARQIELAKAVFAAGVPFFGSCWGLQVAVTAAGGMIYGATNAFNASSSYDLISRLLVIIVLGGMGSIGGALVAGIMMVTIEDLVSVVWGPVWSNLAFFLILVVVLSLRPQGLFGKQTVRVA